MGHILLFLCHRRPMDALYCHERREEGVYMALELCPAMGAVFSQQRAGILLHDSPSLSSCPYHYKWVQEHSLAHSSNSPYHIHCHRRLMVALYTFGISGCIKGPGRRGRCLGVEACQERLLLPSVSDIHLSMDILFHRGGVHPFCQKG